MENTNFSWMYIKFNNSLSQDIDNIIGKKPHIELITNNFIIKVITDYFSHLF